ncbi:response regulator [soil metagenome]
MRILHVDDEPDIREVTALALSLDPTLEVRSVASGQAALKVLEGGWRPDVVLLDVMMPQLDGPATLERIRRVEGLGDLPVIFMTARAQDHEQARFKALGVVGMVVKPFDPMTLAAQIRSMLAASGQ